MRPLLIIALCAAIGCRSDPTPTAPSATAPPAPFKYKGPPPYEPEPPSGRQVVTPPAEGEVGWIFYPDKNVIPVFPVLGDYEAFTAAVKRGESGTSEIMRGKLVPTRTKVKVLRYTGQQWVKLRVEEGTFVGIEGYTFNNVILPKMPP